MTTPGLRRVLTFRDLVLFYLVTGFSLRWIATAAAAGPSALVIWVIAALGLFVPLVFTVLELSSRYPEEGGVYVWSKRAFGPFAAFMTGWTYWGSNLPYFPGLLYFAAANALFVGGPSWQALVHQQHLLHRRLDGRPRRRGHAERRRTERREVAEQRRRAGELDSRAAADRARRRVVEPIRIGDADDADAFVPSTSLKDVIFWSTIAFAFGGVESGSTMGEEIQDARRTVPRAVLDRRRGDDRPLHRSAR